MVKTQLNHLDRKELELVLALKVLILGFETEVVEWIDTQRIEIVTHDSLG